MASGTFNPRAMQLARGALGINQSALAREVGVSQPAVSMWEKGDRVPESAALERLAAALQVLPSGLTDDRVATTTPMFRAAGVKTKRDERRVEGNLELARLAAARIMESVELTPALPWPTADDPLSLDVEEAAQQLRRVWRIPNGPLQSLIAYIEAAGAIVLRVAFGHPKVEAAYAQPRRDSQRWISLNTAATDGARLRLTVAHELGHAVLHHWDAFNVPSEREREAQAFNFALALLVPADEFAMDVIHTSRRWDDFLRLRSKWSVSAAALARRAHNLNLVNQAAYRSLNIERRSRGHWTREPGDIATEQPRLFADTVELLREQGGWADADFSNAAGLPFDRLAELLPEQFSVVDDVPPRHGLRLVG